MCCVFVSPNCSFSCLDITLSNSIFSFSYHSKLIFTPELPIERGNLYLDSIAYSLNAILERLEARRDLGMTVESMIAQLGPKAVLHNLKFAMLFTERFSTRYD
jgi:hypothetical protein